MSEETKPQDQQELKREFVKLATMKFLAQYYHTKIMNLKDRTIGELFDEVSRLQDVEGFTAEEKGCHQVICDQIMNVLYEVKVNDK